jgi:hypothetical protein
LSRASRWVLIAVTLVTAVLIAPPRAAFGVDAADLPQPQSDNSLSGISCVSKADCWATGYAQNDQNRRFGEIFHWTGNAWSAVAGPSSAGSETLGGISCASARSCVAVGYLGGDSTTPRPLTLYYNGSAWSSVATPRVRGADYEAVTCPSTTECWAVGSFGPGATSRTLVLEWDGRSWHQVSTPNPAAKYSNEIESVSCSSIRNCWAFGQYNAPPLKPTIASYIFALHWNGSVWSMGWKSPAYLGGEETPDLTTSVSCVTLSDCWVAGYSTASPLDYRPLLIHWDGRGWSMVKPPPLGQASLEGIDCPSTSTCFTVGNSGSFYGGTRTLTLRLNAAGWARASAPNHDVGTWDDISCSSSTSCIAVGSTFSTKNRGPTENFAEQWTGSAWSTP